MRRTAGVIAVGAVITTTAAVYVRAQDAQTEKMLIANERAVSDAIAKGNLAGFKQHVAADGWSIDQMSGRMPVANFIKGFDAMTKHMKITSWDITDTRTVWVDANARSPRTNGRGQEPRLRLAGTADSQPGLVFDRLDEEERQVDGRLSPGIDPDGDASEEIAEIHEGRRAGGAFGAEAPVGA